MRLRTEMVNPGCGMQWEALLPDHYDAPLRMWAPAAQHDAMAAHALLQAIRQFVDPVPIEKRAAEILAGWLGEEAG